MGNPYTFVGNNPWTWLDPWGLESTSWTGHRGWGENVAIHADGVIGLFDRAVMMSESGRFAPLAVMANQFVRDQTMMVRAVPGVFRLGVGTAEGVVGYGEHGNRLTVAQRALGIGGDAATALSFILPAKQFGGYLTGLRASRAGAASALPARTAAAPVVVEGGTTATTAARTGPSAASAAAPKPGPGLTRGIVECETAVGVGARGKFSVGAYSEIKGTAAGLDAHHVGQKALMKQFVPGYNPASAPAILVPKVGHTIRGPNGILSRSDGGLGSARDVIARDIWELRRVYPDVPNSALQELIQMNKTMYPGAFAK